MNNNNKGFRVVGVLTIVVITVAGFYFYNIKNKIIKQDKIDDIITKQQEKETSSVNESFNSGQKNDILNKEIQSKGGGPRPDGPISESITANINLDSLAIPSGVTAVSGVAKGINAVGVGVTDINGYSVFNGSSSVIEGRWSVEISHNVPTNISSQPLVDGVYMITVFGPYDKILTTEILTIGTLTSDSSKPPTIMFAIEPSYVVMGDSSKLIWRAPNAISCKSGGDWNGIRNIMGSISTGPINANKIYILTCKGSGGSVSKTISITPK